MFLFLATLNKSFNKIESVSWKKIVWKFSGKNSEADIAFDQIREI